jgi:hypothetical protein
MRSSVRAAVLTLIAGLLLPANALAQAQEPAEPRSPSLSARLSRGAAVGFDVLIVRPLGFVATTVGAALFIPAVVVTAPNGRDSIESALELFVIVPAKYVFRRPLGEF